MYITYSRDQIPLLTPKRPAKVKQGGGDFQPTYLVRVEDMTRVPGIEAKEEGYCTLSYSWNYSGDIEIDSQGESYYIDRCQHKIVTDHSGWFESRQEVELVKFEDVVQQICKDFGIKYIWYDKICIDQDDKVAKIKEIKQMYNIYRRSNFTIALIPELHLPDNVKKVDWTCVVKYGLARMVGKKEIAEMQAYVQCMQAILESEWSKRLWTLEEAYMADSLLLVGRNTHIWSSDNRIQLARDIYSFVGTDKADVANLSIYSLLRGAGLQNAHQILFQAHQRTTTKPHDRVFALSHMVTFDVEINYDLPLESVIRQFYANLTEADLTVLCFGKPARPYHNTIQGLYGLPSWTGVEGTHARSQGIYILPQETAINVSRDDQMLMHIEHCAYTRIRPLPASEEMPEIDMHTPESEHGLLTTHYFEIPKEKCSDKILDILLPFAAAIKYNKKIKPGIRTVASLSLTEECEECILLDLPYTWRYGKIFPVVRQQKNIFKSIGVAYLWIDPDVYVNGGLSEIRLADAFEENEDSFIIA